MYTISFDNVFCPEGEFDHDQIHGEGLWSWPDGSSYAGQAKHGVREGKGLYVSPMKVKHKHTYMYTRTCEHTTCIVVRIFEWTVCKLFAVILMLWYSIKRWSQQVSML